MTEITCPRCGGPVAEWVNATTVLVRHAGRTSTTSGTFTMTTTCGQKLAPAYRHCGQVVTIASQEPEDEEIVVPPLRSVMTTARVVSVTTRPLLVIEDNVLE